MKMIFSILCLVSICLATGCGIRETETNEPVIVANAKAAACTFPETLKTKENVLASIDCLQVNVDNAFASLKVKKEGELSFGELKTLQENGLLEFKVGDTATWNGISGNFVISVSQWIIPL